MAAREILLLGNPELYEICAEIIRDDLEEMKLVAEDLADTLLDFRKKYGFGRAIAAPQIGVKRRLIYMNRPRQVVFINPVLTFPEEEMVEIWDDCMSFPDLMVKVMRYPHCRIKYRNLEWEEKAENLEGGLSELLQHECDHLDGILAVRRAVDDKSFALRSQIKIK
jgi:peptide deformylase